MSSRNRPDSVVGQRYRLVRQLGEQASTEIWEAFDARLERPVALRLLAQHSRDNRGAQDRLHRAARERLIADSPDALRVLDGGEDPTYGSFVVAELGNPMQATQPIEFVQLQTEPTRARRPVGPAPERRGFGVLALLALLVVMLAAGVFFYRAFAPSKQPADMVAAAPTSVQVARPLSGAQAGQPAPTLTVRPTLAPAAQPTLAPATPAISRASQPTPPPTTQPAPASPPAPTAVQPTARPAAPAPAAPVPAAPAPAAPVPAAAGSPVATIREHYALIDAKRYSEGYTLMDAHLRSLNSPTDYASWFANKVSIKPIAVDLVSQTTDQAVVHAVVETTDRVNGKDVTTQVAEQFVLRNEAGAWHIDQVSRA